MKVRRTSIPVRGRRWSALAVCVGLVLVGCGPRPYPNSVPVSGVVTLDGKPLEFGNVRFAPDERGEIAVGRIQNGRFTMRTTANTTGVAKGSYKVIISCEVPEEGAAQGSFDPANPPPFPKYKSLIPVRYSDFATSGFEVSITAPIDDLAFRLTSP